MSSPTTREQRKTIIAGAVGNALEWYDFAVYGLFAPIIGKLFFPSDDQFASLLSAFGVFAVGYAARPVGGLILGYIGDKFGRKPALILSVILMGLATTSIGVLPDHAQLGTSAAFLLVALRIFQGISVGGEFAGSIVFLAESAPPERRGYFASWPETGAIFGFLLGSGVAALVGNIVGEQALHDWGWRIPFLLGGVIAILALLARRNLPESPAMLDAEPIGASPVIVAFRDHWRSILHLVSLVLCISIGFFMIFTYAISYMTEYMHVSTARALDISTINLFVMLLVTPLGGALSDRVGRKPILYFVTIGTLVLAWPLWWLMHQEHFAWILAGQLGFAILFGLGYAVITVAIAELLPARVRCTAVSIGYNLCLGVFGGTAPLIATYLVHRTSDDFAPVYYLMLAAVVSLIATFRMPEMAGKPLPR